MTADRPSTRSIVLPILAIVAVGVGLRFFFVDLLTATTGTWIGGVESPHREPASHGPKGPSGA